MYKGKKAYAIKKLYPAGTRLRLMEMKEDPFPVPSGTEGTVEYIDDIGTIHCRWDNGSGLGLIVGVDSFSVISKGGELCE